jgi:glucokinase
VRVSLERRRAIVLIVGDIGGTKTLLALFKRGDDPRKPTVTKEYHSGAFPSLAEIVRRFLSETGETAAVGCFDVAGPVVDGRVHTTNLPWTMDETELARDIGLTRVKLLNDLEAIAEAVPHLASGDLVTLNAGEAEPEGALAVIAPGTGLGEAFLVWSGGQYAACPSEGGHSSYAPVNEQQTALLSYLRAKFGEVSAERACSGMAVGDLYDFFKAASPDKEVRAFATELMKVKDRTPLIAEAGVRERAANPLAAAAIDLFVDNLAVEAGNLALKTLSTGGVYLAGGMPLHVLPLLQTGAFFATFAAKGRLSDVLKRMPVHVVTAQAPLLGATLRGLSLL